MKLFYIAVLSFIFFCCNSKEIRKENKTIYANEYGQITLATINDSLIKALFENNTGASFDTTLIVVNDFKLLSPKDSLPFLKLKMGGLQLHPSHLWIHEFSGFTYLAQFIRIEKMYERPFYKLNEKVAVEGDIISGKGTTIDGIWLLNNEKKATESYTKVVGVIKKEAYPLDYYSTEKSPQGMFGDTSVVHYRLVLNDYTFEPIPTQKYKGSSINIENKAAFIYEFALSEVFYLDKKEPWTEVELHKEIEIEAVLVQFINGKSVLKNWKIVD